MQTVEEIIGHRTELHLAGLFPPPGFLLEVWWVRHEKLPADPYAVAMFEIRWIGRERKPAEMIGRTDGTRVWLSASFPILRSDVEDLTPTQITQFMAHRCAAAVTILNQKYAKAMAKYSVPA